MVPRRAVLALLGLGLLTAGCLGSPVESPSSPTPAADTATPPAGTVALPSGPNAAPDRPATLNESSVRQYVHDYEYRYVANNLWQGQYTDLRLDCRVDGVTERSWGFDVVVTCTGSSTTDPPADSTATVGPHADWFTQSYRYSVSESAMSRTSVENRDPVS